MNKNDKKILFLFPPQWTPISPHFALCSLTGQLKNAGYSTTTEDLNVEFYNLILSKEFLDFTNEKIKNDYVELCDKIKKIYKSNKTAEEYTLQEQCMIYKYGKIKEFLSEDNDEYHVRVPNIIQYAHEIVKDKTRFYQPINLIKAMELIDYALKMVSTAYAPLNLEFESCYNPFMKLTYESIKHFVFDKETNVFWNFLKSKVKEYKNKKYSLIAISLNSSSQLVAGLSLGYLLKKYTNAHISIGGNYFTRIKEEVLKHPEFHEFCDSIMTEEGEGPIVEMARFITGEIGIEKVPNLIYFKNKKSFINEKMTPVKLNNMASVNLDDFDLNAYYTPEIVLPYQTSRGCYWGKCSFCDQDFGQEFNVKNTDKVISEMKELKEKYNINHFEFIDESVSPMYLKELSEKIVSSEIEPKFFMDARLEKQFDEDIFKIASSAGLKMVMWGLESGSKKIMDSINKGIDFDRRFEILKSANKYNIWNFAFIFFGYPLETVEDARKTIKMLSDNKDCINSYGRSVFTMGKHAKIASSPKEYGITKIIPAQEEFSPSIDFECIGMTKNELKTVTAECREESFKNYNNPLWMYLRYREWLFLYVDKFGVDWVSKYSVKL